MNHGLNFKIKQAGMDIENFMNTPSPLDIWPMETVNSLMVEQRSHAQKNIGYIDRKKARWKYVSEFADNHQTVFKKECHNFFKDNPQEFEKEVKRVEKAINISLKVAGVFACLGIIAAVTKFNTLAVLSLTSMAMSVLWSITGVSVNEPLKNKGPEEVKLNKCDFLFMFYKDKNLKELWSSSGDNANGFLLLCKKSKEKNKKDLDKINAYEETAKWLNQWSRGDLDNISEVEWRALKGVVKKYKRFLTPIDSTVLKSENVFQD